MWLTARSSWVVTSVPPQNSILEIPVCDKPSWGLVNDADSSVQGAALLALAERGATSHQFTSLKNNLEEGGISPSNLTSIMAVARTVMEDEALKAGAVALLNLDPEIRGAAVG
ncbi:MAG: hypothetical protein MUC50_21190 [Myxococcota bacterium]|nr:hypothetical protein [Myxococcota bacterium]